MSQGSLVFAANNRLKQALRAELTSEDAGIDTNYAERITTIDAWVEQTWLTLQDKAYKPSCRALLNPAQRHLLWSDIVAGSAESVSLFNDKTLAKIIDDAYGLYYQWRLTQDQLKTDGSLESRCFIQWMQGFEQSLEQQGWIVTELAIKAILKAIEKSILDKVPSITLVGFDRIYPQLEHLASSVALSWSTWERKPRFSPKIRRFASEDFSAEIRAAAQWSRQLISQNPEFKIGIVVPTLNSQRLTVERIFTEVFTPEKILSSKPGIRPPINISAGYSLKLAPIIQDAFNLLALVQPTLTTEQVQSLLHSPFWGNNSDKLCCEALIKIGQSARCSYSHHEFRYFIERCEESLDNREDFSFSTLLLELHYELKQGDKLRAPSEWAAFFLLWLEKCYWPGSRTLNSAEYQQKQKFYQLIETFNGYDILTMTSHSTRKMTVHQALSLLNQLAQGTIFQPKDGSANIHILGTLESSGLQFDQCWIMGMDEQQWPASAKPNPLLPLSLQKKLHMPRSSVTAEKEFAEKLITRFKHCAETVIFSSSLMADNLPLRVSELIADIEPIAETELLFSQNTPLESYLNDLWQSKTLETVYCDKGPPWGNTGAAIPGGSSVIKAQAICPFNAFALFRLGAYSAQKPSLGLTPAERGSLVHEVMARLWKYLVSQETLNKLSSFELDKVIKTEVEAALRYWISRRSDIMQGRFIELEKERLKAIAETALNIDRQRPPFTVVATEQSITLSLAETHFDLRIDRIDQLQDHEYLIIDYKTADINMSGWSGERPSEPQLLLYASAEQDNKMPIAGIALWQLDLKNSHLAGLGQFSSDNQNIAGIIKPEAKTDKFPGDWVTTQAHWSTVLNQLTEEFLEGRCERTYYHPQQAHYYTDLLPLNRLPEAEDLPQS